MDQAKEESSSVLRRLSRNLAILFSGAAAIAVLGLGTLTLNTRALGPTQFGLLVLVQSYVVICGRVFSFDTWQAIIKFGAEYNARRDIAGLRAVTSFALLFDASSALAAGAVGLLLLWLFPQLVGLSSTELPAAAVYTATLFVQLQGAPVGLLRLYDKFSWLTAITAVEAAGRFFASVLLFALKAPLSVYFYAFAAVLIASNIVRTVVSLVLLRRATGQLHFSELAELRKVARPFLRFSSGSWVTGTLNVTRRDGTTLIVAALLGPAAAGLYGLAVRIVRPIRDLAELVRQAIFPDLSKLRADANHRVAHVVVMRVLVRTLPTAIAIALAGILFGDVAIRLFAGPAYAEAYWPLILLIVAASLYLCMPVLSSLVILYSGMRAYSLGAIAAGAVWAAVVVWPMLWWGIRGAGLGELAYVLAWLAFNLALLAPHRRFMQR